MHTPVGDDKAEVVTTMLSCRCHATLPKARNKPTDLSTIHLKLAHTPCSTAYQCWHANSQHIQCITWHSSEHPAAIVWPHSTISVTPIIKRVPAARFDQHTSCEPHAGGWRQCGTCDNQAELGSDNAGFFLLRGMAVSSQHHKEQ